MNKINPYSLFLFFVTATIPFLSGANQPLIHGLYIFLTLLAGGIWLTLNFDAIQPHKRSCIPYLACFILAFISLTTVNLPMQVVEIISPVRAANLMNIMQEKHSFSIANSLSYYIPGSQFYALYGLTLLVLFYFSAGLLQLKQNRVIFLWIITLTGSVEALYGIIQTISPEVLWTPAPDAAGKYPSGTFADNDLFAAFLNICWPVSLVLGLSLIKKIFEKIEFLEIKKKNVGIVDWIKLPFHYFVLPLWCTALIILGIILSKSASGIVIMFILVILCRIAIPYPRSIKIIFSGIIYASLILYGWYLGVQGIISRTTLVVHSAQAKIAFWSDSLVMLKEHLYTGIGMGSYPFMAPLYLPAHTDPLGVSRNDYLELLLELGLPAASFLCIWLAAGVIYYTATIYKMPRKLDKMTTDEIFIIGSFYAFFGLVLNITAGDILRTPVVTFYAAGLLGLLYTTLLRRHDAAYKPEYLFIQRKPVRFVPYRKIGRKRRR